MTELWWSSGCVGGNDGTGVSYDDNGDGGCGKFGDSDS